MKITEVKMNNYTVFSDNKIEFSPGINVFIGENGTGKTHLLKLLYAAVFSTNGRIAFPYKLVRVMLPLQMQIRRLVAKAKGNQVTDIKIKANQGGYDRSAEMKISFHKKTKKWDAETIGQELWETKFSDSSSVFIPAKEVLSNNYNLGAAVERGNVQFDDTYIDVLNAAKVDVSLGRIEKDKNNMLKEIEQIIGGKVTYDSTQDMFFLKKGSAKEEFNLVSEGIRKLALLWVLVKNGALEEGSVLFWDEPEANINPAAIPVIVKLLLALQRHGVQVFIATHDYFLSKYIEVERRPEDKIFYHSFYKNGNLTVCEKENKFTLLKNNPIMSTFVKLYRDEVEASFKNDDN